MTSIVQAVVSPLSVMPGGTKFFLGFKQPCSPGNSAVLCVAIEGNAVINSVTDDAGNIYTAIVQASVGSGSTQEQAAIYLANLITVESYRMSIELQPSTPPVRLMMALFEINGGTNAIVVDASGTASFAGGSETLTPNLTLTLADQFDLTIAIVACHNTGVTATPMTGWTNLSIFGLYSFCYQSMGSVDGSFLVEPVTLNNLTPAVLATVAFGSPQVVPTGVIIAPRFPDAFSPRLADYLYDSALQ